MPQLRFIEQCIHATYSETTHSRWISTLEVLPGVAEVKDNKNVKISKLSAHNNKHGNW